MIEIIKNLLIGSVFDYNKYRNTKGYFLMAAKEPFHRQALGYKTRGAPKDSKEYLFAYRDHYLILNMVDAPKKEFFDDRMINEAIEFIHKHIQDDKVFVVCNQGKSRSASLAFMYCIKHVFNPLPSFLEAEEVFREMYPKYEPAKGIYEYTKDYYNNMSKNENK